MLKDFIWNTFENTGDVSSYVFYKELSYNKMHSDAKNRIHDKELIDVDKKSLL